MPNYAALRPSSSRASEAARASSKKRNTRCEVALRRALTSVGLRYRLDASDLVGRPDIVFRRVRVVVFCDGDYWHGRNLSARIAKLAAGHNASYWIEKIRSNVERDQRVRSVLEAEGWLVLRYWETDIHKDAMRIANEIARAVRARQRVR